MTISKATRQALVNKAPPLFRKTELIRSATKRVKKLAEAH